jgi:hypothetical protein
MIVYRIYSLKDKKNYYYQDIEDAHKLLKELVEDYLIEEIELVQKRRY